ncbi:MAG TPA: imidazole glycerol phosphate synthase subunit HisH [Candidatus Hydrogenedentes bacterium]|nr:imidazole glycerol phosphate synthase subunit HisH [Candidatus Hydrogenedentota bacterium]HOL77730.1 imidazole glycerol phosphate synthase subunit HisH [Candidatus Hydrogenedentota bacterium]HPO86853.1 imidazole glycerol phosphate synthase subunit HisH [Candidatus Hydrogenedentota bacterium]
MIVIVDYKAGNLTSVRLALEHLKVEAKVTQNQADILAADRVIFPGVGAAGAAMKSLNELNLVDTIRTVVARGTPFLGICLGTQVIFEYSEEDGGTPCIGLIPGKVRKFQPKDPACKIPQIGWNEVKFTRGHPLFAGIEDESEFYFVHSYYPVPTEADYVLATTEYADVRFASIVGRDNLVATQFHPERSGRIGLRLLRNFCDWDGTC